MLSKSRKGSKAMPDKTSEGYDRRLACPVHEYENGCIYNMDCLDFLQSLDDATATVVFADPPYNIKKAAWDNIGNQEEYVEWSVRWIKEAARVLNESGTLFICGYTEILADIKRPAMEFFDKCKWLIWYYDNKANLSNDWGRSHESILCLRKSGYLFNVDDVRIPYNSHTMKYPSRAMSGENSQYSQLSAKVKVWTPNERGAKPKDVICIPTTCNGMGEKTPHPTQKPEALVRKLILSSSNVGDLVVDPFSGSGTTAVVATQLQRRFAVNDLIGEYNEWANDRILNVQNRSIEEWIEYDKKNELRRRSLEVN